MRSGMRLEDREVLVECCNGESRHMIQRWCPNPPGEIEMMIDGLCLDLIRAILWVRK